MMAALYFVKEKMTDDEKLLRELFIEREGILIRKLAKRAGLTPILSTLESFTADTIKSCIFPFSGYTLFVAFGQETAARLLDTRKYKISKKQGEILYRNNYSVAIWYSENKILQGGKTMDEVTLRFFERLRNV